jgi:hypothetical protein
MGMVGAEPMKCHYGIELPDDGSACPKCGVDEKGQCGFAYHAGWKDGVDAVIVALEKQGVAYSLGKGDMTFGAASPAADWVRANRPPEPT